MSPSALVAYGSLACGADMLVAEAILARGGELHVVLPFAEEDFLKTSVHVGGPEWSASICKGREKRPLPSPLQPKCDTSMMMSNSHIARS